MTMQANIRKLDEYIGVFYEDNLEKKVVAAKNILVLLLDLKNIQTLLEHQSLLQTLSRNLQEQHKKSIELCVCIESFFYVLANYRQFHQYLTEYSVGAATIQILQYQIDRFDLRYSEYIELWKKSGSEKSNKAEIELKKLNILISKQDKLFFVCLNILMNLGEDPTIQKKMKKKGIIKILIRMLERNDFNLLIVTLLFLRKLSIFSQNKQQMIELNVIEKLSRFFTCDNDILLQLALAVYKNLCFDKSAREKIEAAGLIPKFIQILNSPSRFAAIVILYLLSIDEKIRYTLAYTDLMSLVLQLIMHFPEKIVGAELVALAINLGANDRNVQHVSEEDLYGLLDRALRNEDTKLLKFCKNIFKSNKCKQLKQSKQITKVGKERLKDFIKIAMTKAKNQELLIQIIGIMAQINIKNQWKEFLTNNFIDFLSKQITDGLCEDDITLETVMLISNICQGQLAAQLLEKKIFKSILNLFIQKVEDPQFTIQLLYCIYMFIGNQIGVEDVIQSADVLMRLLLLVESPYQPLRKMNDEVLNVLREYDDIQLLQSIKQRKFYQHNKEWILSTEHFANNQQYYQMMNGYDQQELDPRMWESEDDYD